MNEKCDLDQIYNAEEWCLLEMKTLKEFKSKLKMLLQIALRQFSSNLPSAQEHMDSASKWAVNEIISKVYSYNGTHLW